MGLLIVGSRGGGGVKRILLGSISEGIVHHARRPVLVMRGGESAWPPARVVIGDDSSADAKEARELAASIGRLSQARTLLVRIHPERLKGANEARGLGSREADGAMRRDEAESEGRADGLEDILEQRPRTAIRTCDDPAVAILEVAREGEGPAHIVVGSRGLGKVQRVRLGSVATKVVRAAAGPALVYAHPREVQPL